MPSRTIRTRGEQAASVQQPGVNEKGKDLS